MHLQVRKPPRVVDFTLASGEPIFPIENKELIGQTKANNLALGEFMIHADRECPQYKAGGKLQEFPSSPSLDLSQGPTYSFNKVVNPELLARANCLDVIERQMAKKLENFKKQKAEDDEKRATFEHVKVSTQQLAQLKHELLQAKL